MKDWAKKVLYANLIVVGMGLAANISSNFIGAASQDNPRGAQICYEYLSPIESFKETYLFPKNVSWSTECATGSSSDSHKHEEPRRGWKFPFAVALHVFATAMANDKRRKQLFVKINQLGKQKD